MGDAQSEKEGGFDDEAIRDVGMQSRRRVAIRGLIEYGAVLLFYMIIVAAFMGHVLWSPFDHIPEPRNFFLERADQDLIMWILSWNWHAAFLDPWTVFDANIFHPARATLAGAEHMFGVTPLYGPVYEITGNPVFALNVTQLLTLSLCGVAMYALLRHWGVMRAGALFGGFVYALYPGQIHGSPALQMLSRQYLPLALIFLDRTVHQAQLRWAIGLAGFVIWQMSCSVYLAFISAVSLVAYSAVLLLHRRRRPSLRGIALTAGAGLVVAAVLVPMHLPYLSRISDGVIEDYSVTNWIQIFSSGPLWNWIIPPIAIREWGMGMRPGVPSYLGVFPALAAVSILFFDRRESASWAAPASLAILLAGYVFALGPHGTLLGRTFTLPYGHLAEWIPGFSSMRVPSRFSVATMTGLSALAGIGLGRALGALVERGRSRWLAAGIAGGLLVGTALEYDLPLDRPAALRVPVGDEIPPVYSALAKLPPGPLLEMPWFTPVLGLSWRSASQSMYFSTFHWNRLLNGYTGYPPPSAAVTGALTRALPDRQALEILARATGVRYIIVHLEKLPLPLRARWEAGNPDLQLVERFGDDALFRVARPIEADLIGALRGDSSPGHTMLGTPIESIPEHERRADLRFTIEPRDRVPRGADQVVEVEVHNPTDRTWPALSSDPTDLVSLNHRLVTPEGATIRLRRREPMWPGRLPYDLSGGDRLRVGFWLIRPREPGRYVLEVWVEQSGHRFEGSLLRRDVVFE